MISCPSPQLQSRSQAMQRSPFRTLTELTILAMPPLVAMASEFSTSVSSHRDITAARTFLRSAIADHGEPEKRS